MTKSCKHPSWWLSEETALLQAGRPLPTCQDSAEGLPTPPPCSKSQFYEKQNDGKGRICKWIIQMMCLGVQEQHQPGLAKLLLKHFLSNSVSTGGKT